MAKKNRFMQDDDEMLDPGEVLTTLPEAPKPEPKTEPKPAPVKAAAPVESKPIDSILEGLIPNKPKPKPETYGFYLDSDVHNELVRLAKANKTNKSKFLNTLLRRVLFGE